MHSWTECGNELRLVERQAKKGETQKAVACYGAREPVSQERYLFFSDGQPNTEATIEFLKRLLALAAQKAKQALLDTFGELEFEVDDIQFVPQTSTPLSDEEQVALDAFIDMLDYLEDVQNVFHNAG